MLFRRLLQGFARFDRSVRRWMGARKARKQEEGSEIGGSTKRQASSLDGIGKGRWLRSVSCRRREEAWRETGKEDARQTSPLSSLFALGTSGRTGSVVLARVSSSSR
jgi:hypothetical protein